jgi:hypothetical protein
MRSVLLLIAIEAFSVYLRAHNPAEWGKYQAETNKGGVVGFIAICLLVFWLMDIAEIVKNTPRVR